MALCMMCKYFGAGRFRLFRWSRPILPSLDKKVSSYIKIFKYFLSFLFFRFFLFFKSIYRFHNSIRGFSKSGKSGKKGKSGNGTNWTISGLRPSGFPFILSNDISNYQFIISIIYTNSSYKIRVVVCSKRRSEE